MIQSKPAQTIHHCGKEFGSLNLGDIPSLPAKFLWAEQLVLRLVDKGWMPYHRRG